MKKLKDKRATQLIKYHEAWKVEIFWFLLSPPDLAAFCFLVITRRICFAVNEAAISCLLLCVRSTVLIQVCSFSTSYSLVILGYKGHWRENWDLFNPGDTQEWDDGRGSVDSKRPVLGVGEDAPDTGVLGLGAEAPHQRNTVNLQCWILNF